MINKNFYSSDLTFSLALEKMAEPKQATSDLLCKAEMMA